MKNVELATSIKTQFSTQETIKSGELVKYIAGIFPDLSKSTIAWKINQLKSEKYIFQSGRGIYTFNFKPDFQPDLALKSKRIYNKFKSFANSDIVVWDTTMLDIILDCTSVKKSTFLLLQKDELTAVFEQAQSLSKPVFLEPSAEIIQRYILPQNETIILNSLISETPLQNCGDYLVPTIEGVLVNAWLISESFLEPMKYSIENIYKKAFEKYNVNTKKLLRYASRRDQKKEIEQLLQKL